MQEASNGKSRYVIIKKMAFLYYFLYFLNFILVCILFRICLCLLPSSFCFSTLLYALCFALCSAFDFFFLRFTLSSHRGIAHINIFD